MKCSELVRLLKSDGWFVVRQEGSHIMMRHSFEKGQFMGTQGDSLEELKKNILEAVNLAFSEDVFNYNMDEIELRHTAENAERSLH